MGDLSKNFSKDEFKCPCCGYFHDRKSFIEKMQKLRNKIGLAIRVSSGCRCLLHNISVGGAEKSAHLKIAGDISCNDMKLLLHHALKIFPRVGISADYIHVDDSDDPDKTQDIYWVYIP